jgi:hypothetical protein
MIAFMRTEVCEAPFQLVEHACIHADERKKRGQHNETSKYTSQRTTHYKRTRTKKVHPRKKNPYENRQMWNYSKGTFARHKNMRVMSKVEASKMQKL